MALTAVVLAGGPPDEVSRTDPAAPNKAFVRIAGSALVTRTLAALRSSPEIGRIIVVAPPAAHRRQELAGADELRADGPHIGDSLRSGLAGLPAGEPVVVAASDLPFLTAAAIGDFLTIVAARDADVAYACVERATHEARYPGLPHTWAKMSGGTYCGGGLVSLKPRVFGALERFLDRLGSARKNPLALASIFGPEVLFRYATGSLTIAGVERRASELLDAPAAAAVCSFAEIAFNVDRASDLEPAESYAMSTG